MNYPGYEAASANGYELLLTHSDEIGIQSATYTKDQLSLRVDKNGKATLFALVGIIKVSVEDFSFPNKNFANFESAIIGRLPSDQK